MQAGFALVEAGFTRAKNAVNILMKNLSDFTLGSICFWLIGFSLMFGPHIIEGVGLGKISFLETGLLLDWDLWMSFLFWELVGQELVLKGLT